MASAEVDWLINTLENKAMVINDLAETLDKYVALERNVKIQQKKNNPNVRKSKRLIKPEDPRELKRLRNLYGDMNGIGNYINSMKADILARKEELIHMILANRQHIVEIKKNKEIYKAVGRMIKNRASRVTFMNENEPSGSFGGAGGGPAPSPSPAWGGEELDGLDELANLFGRSGINKSRKRKSRKSRKNRKTRRN